MSSHSKNEVPLNESYELDQNFLKTVRPLLISCLTFTLAILALLLFLRPINIYKNRSQNYGDDKEFNRIIYINLSTYGIACFSLSLNLYLLDKKKLTTNMMMFPVLISLLKSLALPAYYFYYTNNNSHGYGFLQDEIGWVYLFFSLILFILYLVLFVKIFKEKDRMKKYNAMVMQKGENGSVNINDLINNSFNKYFKGTRVNPTYEGWLKSHIRENLRRDLDIGRLVSEINDQMSDSRDIHKSGENYFSATGSIPAEGHEVFTSFLNHHYSGGRNEGTLPIHAMQMDLKGNNYLNPKLLTYIDHLESSGKDTNQIMDHLPFNSSNYGDMRKRISDYIGQIKSNKRFRNF